MPLLPVGIAIGLAQTLKASHQLTFLGALHLFVGVVAWFLNTPSYFIGTLTTTLSMTVVGKSNSILRFIAGLSVGVYLLHPFCFLLIYKYAPNLTWSMFTVVGFTGSVCITSFLLASRRLRESLFGIA